MNGGTGGGGEKAYPKKKVGPTPKILILPPPGPPPLSLKKVKLKAVKIYIKSFPSYILSYCGHFYMLNRKMCHKHLSRICSCLDVPLAVSIQTCNCALWEVSQFVDF